MKFCDEDLYGSYVVVNKIFNSYIEDIREKGDVIYCYYCVK